MDPAEICFASLAGQVALVTGASSELGRRFAKTLTAAGVAVAVAARRTAQLEELVEEIRRDGGSAFAVPLDVSKPESFAAAVDAIEQALGQVTILVNNAGFADFHAMIDVPQSVVEKMNAVHINGPLLLSQEIARRLIATARPGRIVNISSIGAFNYSSQSVHAGIYTVTKAAMVRLTEVLADEWVAHHINVNAIAPGYIETELTGDYFKQHGTAVLQKMRRGRVGRPSDLDSTLLYLVSPASGFVTGTCIKVDDGQMPR